MGSDHGPEFTSSAVIAWRPWHRPHFIALGKPMQDGICGAGTDVPTLHATKDGVADMLAAADAVTDAETGVPEAGERPDEDDQA